jgi:hypothetical protein
MALRSRAEAERQCSGDARSAGTGGKVVVVFMLLLLGLGLITFVLSRLIGLDMTFP